MHEIIILQNVLIWIVFEECLRPTN